MNRDETRAVGIVLVGTAALGGLVLWTSVVPAVALAGLVAGYAAGARQRAALLAGFGGGFVASLLWLAPLAGTNLWAMAGYVGALAGLPAAIVVVLPPLACTILGGCGALVGAYGRGAAARMRGG